MPECIELVRAGTLRPLAVTTATRSPVLPNLPAIGDFLPGYEASAWYGFGAPRNIPAEIVDMLNQEVNAGLADPKLKARLADLGGTAIAGSPGDFAKFVTDEEVGKGGQVCRGEGGVNSETLTPAFSPLEHPPIEVTALAHGVVRIGLMHDAAVVPQHPVAQHPVAMAPVVL